MYALININTLEKVSDLPSLPATRKLPDGGLSLLNAVGDEVPAHNPAYRVVERVVVSEAPAYPHTVTSESEAPVSGRLEVARTYAPDKSAYQSAIEAHVDAVAGQRQYTDAVSIATYVSSTNEQWAAEASAFIAWRDSVWLYAFAELAKAEGGQRTIPTIDEFIGELPVIEWP